jgi:hypothetical protein
MWLKTQSKGTTYVKFQKHSRPWLLQLLQNFVSHNSMQQRPFLHSATHGTIRCITVFTRTRQRSLSWATRIQSTPSKPIYLRSILISYLGFILLRGPLPAGFPTKFCTHFLSPPCTLHAPLSIALPYIHLLEAVSVLTEVKHGECTCAPNHLFTAYVDHIHTKQLIKWINCIMHRTLSCSKHDPYKTLVNEEGHYTTSPSC